MASTNTDRQASKYLSLILRHDPSAGGVVLDEQDWVSIDSLLAGMAAAGTTLTLSDLERIVVEDSKGRYTIEDGRIRANQGHSVDIDLGLTALVPPHPLFHGTATRFIESILRDGLLPQARQYVHLSANRQTAIEVGSRHGKICVLTINANAMTADGLEFFRSANGVWLVAQVPSRYLSIDDE
jgi:putative RNA 2'-phosphotransferase